MGKEAIYNPLKTIKHKFYLDTTQSSESCVVIGSNVLQVVCVMSKEALYHASHKYEYENKIM